MTEPTLRRRILQNLELGPVSLAGLELELDVDETELRDELRRLLDARLARTTNRGWQLRNDYTTPNRSSR
jgi:predicted transcriptional regulator